MSTDAGGPALSVVRRVTECPAKGDTSGVGYRSGVAALLVSAALLASCSGHPDRFTSWAATTTAATGQA